MTSTDRIEKQILLRAPRSRVWRALTDHVEFGTWFGAALDGPFLAGARVTGRITSPGYEHVAFEVTEVALRPEESFSFRWHPHAVDADVDYSQEPTTLVEFRLVDRSGGTLLTVVESGFDRLPPGRRDEAFRMNSGGWEMELENVRRHVGG